MTRRLLLAALLLPVSTAAAANPSLCLQAAQDAARETGVPVAVMVALTLTETGRGDPLQPWPWTLNLGGPGVWADTRTDALARLDQEIAAGRSNIDVGCFQINLGWHGQAFANAEAMLDPLTNARYAAQLVAGHYQDLGDWTLAAAAFHSKTPELAEKYLARFEPILASLEQGVPLPDDLPEKPNAYPLLQAGLAGSPGSLVPLTSAGRPLFGAP